LKSSQSATAHPPHQEVYRLGVTGAKLSPTKNLQKHSFFSRVWIAIHLQCSLQTNTDFANVVPKKTEERGTKSWQKAKRNLRSSTWSAKKRVTKITRSGGRRVAKS
jgi:hypothetical protein